MSSLYLIVLILYHIRLFFLYLFVSASIFVVFLILLFYVLSSLVLFFFFFFFFKQKTAYEMRISDWSSDVCSSDLPGDRRRRHCLAEREPSGLRTEGDRRREAHAAGDSDRHDPRGG